MKELIYFLLFMISVGNAEAQELVCTLDGAVIDINEVGTYLMIMGAGDLSIWLTIGAVGGILFGVGLVIAKARYEF